MHFSKTRLEVRQHTMTVKSSLTYSITDNGFIVSLTTDLLTTIILTRTDSLEIGL